MPNSNQPATANETSPFYVALKQALSLRGTKIAVVCPPDDHVALRVLHDYGAIFIAGDKVAPPPACVYSNEEQVSRFQKAARCAAATIDDSVIELQPAAMDALLSAREAALSEGLNITPRDGAEAARRNYADTVRLWNSRFLPALNHWQNLGRLSSEQVDRLRALQINEQVPAVLG